MEKGKGGRAGGGCFVPLMNRIVIVIVLVFGMALIAGFVFGNLGTTLSNMLNSLLNPRTNTVSTNLILERVQQLSELTSTRYTFSNIVTSEREMPGVLGALYGDRLVIVAVGYIEAGVDLNQLTPESVTLADGILTLRLDGPVIQSCFLDESKIQVISRDTGLFARPSATLDTVSRQFALQQFRENAIEQGILSDAQIQAEASLEAFLGMFAELADNITAVDVIVGEPNPNAPAPANCQGG